MPDQLQLRGGTTAEHSTFTGASKEVTVDTTKKTAVVHDGTTAGGIPLLRQDGSNSALALGSQGTPSLKWDANTGIYSPGEDQLAVATNGVQRINIEADGDINIDSNTVFIDAVNNRVGIGTNSPNKPLHIYSGSSDSEIRLQSNSGTEQNAYFSLGNSGGKLDIYSVNGDIALNPGNSVAATFKSDGKVGIGTTSPKSILTTQGNIVGLSETTHSLQHYQQAAASYTVTSIDSVISGASGLLVFKTAANWTNGDAVEAARIRSDGMFEVKGAGTAGSSPAFSVNGSAPANSAIIDTSGRLLVGTSTALGTGQVGFLTSGANQVLTMHNSNAAPFGLVVKYTTATPNGTGAQFVYLEDATALRCEIRSNGGIANYSGNNVNLSDINTKKDISPAAGTWDCIKEWEIVNYRYKDQSDDADLNLGVIAQQVAESCPEVITIFQEAKEATEDKPAQEERLGVKEQQMYWMAIKALQEAMGRIETLEQRLIAAGID
jgi:hypothetical protein